MLFSIKFIDFLKSGTSRHVSQISFYLTALHLLSDIIILAGSAIGFGLISFDIQPAIYWSKYILLKYLFYDSFGYEYY